MKMQHRCAGVVIRNVIQVVARKSLRDYKDVTAVINGSFFSFFRTPTEAVTPGWFPCLCSFC